MGNNRGWICLHRKIMEDDLWLLEPFTKAQAWVDLLLLANHETGFIRRRGILVAVDRGCVGYSERQLAQRWQWSRDKVRRYFVELTRVSRISRKISEKTIPKNASVSGLIYITNYEKYQANDTENDTEDDTEDDTRTTIKNKNKQTPRDFFSKISALKQRYQNQEPIDQAFVAISSTRKTNRIADSVKLSILQAWEHHPVESVMSGIRTYLDKSYHHQGKNEKYLLGIIRNSNGTEINDAPEGKIMKATGSPTLDEHYRGQGYRIT